MNQRPARWQFWIDRGGTFTDVVAKRPDGTLATLKLLSDHPEQYRDAAVAGIRRLLGLAPNAPITSAQVESVKMGTTVATNALLERKGEPTLLVTTRGFRDALRIAYQDRPRLFERRIVLPELLYARVVEADERMSAARRGRARARRGAPRGRPAKRVRRPASPASRSSSCTAGAITRTSSPRNGSRAGSALRRSASRTASAR